jgi:WhiB family redox-sensing transcriptional regulator
VSPAPACRDSDPELFFPERGRGFVSGSYRRQYEEAAAVCAGCPVRARCLEENLDVPFGIWGGLDPHDRGKLLAAEGRLNGKGRPQFRNMSPIPNDNQVHAQRARRQAEIDGDVKRMSHARHADEYNARRRERRRQQRETLAQSA